MPDRLYTEYPGLYDAIQAEWDYDRDVAWLVDRFEERGVAPETLLEIGCGTGEHTRRLTEYADVTAVEPAAGMLSLAREKTDATFREGALPDLTVGGTFDAAVALRGVVNHLAPAELEPALAAVADRLADDGLFVFDNSPLPPEGNDPALDIGTTAEGEYARVVQMNPTADDRLRWDSLVYVDGEWFLDSRPMTPFADSTVAATLSRTGFAVRIHEGFGPADRRSVFVATPR
jgi:SAM-dependent methyltransferase